MSFEKRPIHFSRHRTVLVASALLLCVAGVGWGGHKCHRTRAFNRCGIPGQYEYLPTSTTVPVRTVSATAIMLRGKTPPPAAAAPGGATTAASPGIAPLSVTPAAPTQVKFYQLTQAQLAIDHCSISRVALLLEDNGHWRLSLQADQNPKETNPVPSATAAVRQALPQLQTSHILRNEFHVVIRGYGGYLAAETPDSSKLGKPVMFRIEIDPFWVQNGVPRDMVWDQMSYDVSRYFDLIDRIEIDLSYR